MMTSKHFWKATGERAVKTMAQAAVVLLGADVVNVLTTDWGQLVAVSLGAGLLSVLTSVASAQVNHSDDPSLV